MSEPVDLCREVQFSRQSVLQFAVWDEEDLFNIVVRTAGLSVGGSVLRRKREGVRENKNIDFMMLHGSTCHCSV